MAIWNGSAIATNQDAFVFNQLYKSEAIPIIRKRNFLINAFSGTPQPGDSALETKFSRTEDVSGRKFEVTLLGQLRTVSGVSDGASEIATASLSLADGSWGAMEFNIAHYKDILPIPESEVMRYKGDALKGASLVDRYFQLAMLSLENSLGTDINATGASVGPSRTKIGSWVHAVSDGTSSGETNYATYGTLDRSDAANSFARAAHVNVSTGALSLSKIGDAMVAVAGNMGNPRVAVAGTTVYNRFRGLVEGYCDAEMDGEFMEFAGAKVRYAGMTLGLDYNCPSGTLGIFDPESWVLKRADIPFTSTGLVQDVSRTATYVLHYGGWFSLICVQPNVNAKLTNITG